MDFNLMQKSIEFHGKDLIEALYAEQGDNFVANVYTNEVLQKGEESRVHNSDRKKAIVNFIAQKADMLFKKHRAEVCSLRCDFEDRDSYAVLPPIESYVEFTEDARRRHFYESLVKGDIVIGNVSAQHVHGLIITIICMNAVKMRYIHDLNIKCFCNTHHIPPLSVHEDPLEAYHSNDLVQGIVLDVNAETEKIYISMKESCLPQSLRHLKLGLINDDDLPLHYKESVRSLSIRYEEKLESTLGFMNPGIVPFMSKMMGLNLKNSDSLMRGLHGKAYDRDDYADELYKVQCAKWAYKSVKEGVQHFKSGNTVEAFQYLNKALQMDTQNVEALVARGALFANNTSFSRAMDDFSKALEINPKHVNAIKFSVETLVAFGKQYEENGCTEEAIKCYRKALLLNPSHAEAMYYMKSSQKKAAEQEKEKARQLLKDNEDSIKKDTSAESSDTPALDTRQKLQQLLSKEKHEGKKRKIPLTLMSLSSTSSSSSSSSATSSPTSSTSSSISSSPSSSHSLDSSSSSYSKSSSSSRSPKHKTGEKYSRRRNFSGSSSSKKLQTSGDTVKPSVITKMSGNGGKIYKKCQTNSSWSNKKLKYSPERGGTLNNTRTSTSTRSSRSSSNSSSNNNSYERKRKYSSGKYKNSQLDSSNSHYSEKRRYSEENRHRKKHKHSRSSRSTSLSKPSTTEYQNRWKEPSGKLSGCDNQGVDSTLSRSSHGKSTSVDGNNQDSQSHFAVESLPTSSRTCQEQSESTSTGLGDSLDRSKSRAVCFFNSDESKSKNVAGTRQSLEELESFLAALKATKMTTPTSSRKRP